MRKWETEGKHNWVLLGRTKQGKQNSAHNLGTLNYKLQKRQHEA